MGPEHVKIDSEALEECAPTLLQLLEQLEELGGDGTVQLKEIERRLAKRGWEPNEIVRIAHRRQAANQVLIGNVQRARAWFKERGPERGVPLELVARHDFQLLERTEQPALPGQLPEGFHEWDTDAPRALPLTADEGTGSVVDRQRQPIEFRSRRLPVAK
jgi:hypothetical protein